VIIEAYTQTLTVYKTLTFLHILTHHKQIKSLEFICLFQCKTTATFHLTFNHPKSTIYPSCATKSADVRHAFIHLHSHSAIVSWHHAPELRTGLAAVASCQQSEVHLEAAIKMSDLLRDLQAALAKSHASFAPISTIKSTMF
jgi:hypothetical protein